MDIEEDIKILENLKKYLNLLIYEETHKIIYNDLGWDEKTIDCINAIDHILAEREEDKKKIAELEAKLEFYQWGDLDNLKFEEYMKEFIPKQKVKDNFNKLITRIKEFKDPEIKKYFSIEQIIDLLEQFENKLLEDK